MKHLWFVNKIIICYVFFLSVFDVVQMQLPLLAEDSKAFQEHKMKRSYQTHRSRDHFPGNSLKTISTNRGPVFTTENSSVVFAQKGGTAKLPCVVRKFSNGVVSWIRKEDSPPTILTVGPNKYIADDRFLVEHTRHLQNWGLIIQHVKPYDAGIYECQVSTHPAASIFVELRVTEASAEIMGAPDLHIRAGSTLRLVCTLLHSTEKPAYVFWYHEWRMINHDPGISVATDRASSVLEIKEADTSHNGNYTCFPENTIPAFINVHVLNATEEENPAAMLHANSSSISTALFVSVLLTVTFNIFVYSNS